MTTRRVSDLERFYDYARAFEVAFLGDRWADLDGFFAPGAWHRAHDAGPLGEGGTGRDGVIAGLRESTHGIDRRFDVRIPEVIEGPEVRPDGIWMRYALALRRAGAPELRFEGDHLVAYDGSGRIRSIEERLEPGTGARVAAYLAEHGSRLRPPGSPPCTGIAPGDARDLEAAVSRTLARFYGAAKSVQDVEAALAVCGPDFVLDSPSMGAIARGRDQARAQLELFFSVFPDYRVSVEGLAAEAGTVACWGRARMTFAGDFLDLAATGRAADLPFVSLFSCAGGALGGERFVFDLATLCRQIEVPVEAMTRALGLVPAAVADAAVAGAEA